MEEKTATVREFLRNYKKFTSKKKPLIITNNGKAEIVVIAYKEWTKRKKENQKFGIKDLKKYCIDGGPKDLSQKIDEVAYPYPNKLKR